MKNTYFHKLTAITIGALLTLSSSAFATTDRTQAITNDKGLGNSQLLVAQGSSLRNVPAFAKSIAVADTALGNALAAAQSQAISGPKKGALAESIAKATSLLGNATALSGSVAISHKQAVAKSLAEAETVLGDALAIAQSDAISGPGKPAIAKSLASAKTAVGNATAIASSSAR